jgi:coenzyme F420 hydrogenase subunit beta
MLTESDITPVVPVGADLSPIEKVIAADVCIGCGACAFARPSTYQMKFDEYGRWIAQVSSSASAEDLTQGSRLCPMSGEGANEDDIADTLYPDLSRHPEIGRHGICGAIAVREGHFRAEGSSGGLTSWLLATLIQLGEVAAVVHVKPRVAEADGPLFEYATSTRIDQIEARAKSRYHSVEMSEVLRTISAQEGPVAIVGVPCFIKAVRKLCAERPELNRKVRYCVSLVCGHQKSRRYADLLALQLDVGPGEVKACDFRRKLPDRPASEYAFEVQAAGGDEATSMRFAPMDSLIGGNWGQGFLKLSACDFCDDVVGECADISIGDAWLPGYVDDSRGTNIVIVRDAQLSRLIDGAIHDGRLEFSELSADQVAASQRGGFNHRREGLAYRLHFFRARAWWAPAKRVVPNAAIPAQRRRIYTARMMVSRRSHQIFLALFSAGRLDQLTIEMRRLQEAYVAVARTTFLDRVGRRLAKLMKRIGFRSL